jgi:YidC/Oxa1 family membrane protein insertase
MRLAYLTPWRRTDPPRLDGTNRGLRRSPRETVMSMNPGGMLPPLEPQGPDNKRLLITVALMTMLWMVFQQFLPAQTPAPEAKTPVASDAATAAAAAQAPTPEAVAATSDALPEVRKTIHVDVTANRMRLDAEGKAKLDAGMKGALRGGYLVEASSFGAQLARFELTGYEDNSRRDAKTGAAPKVDLAGGEHEGARVFALASRGGDVLVAANAPYEVVSEDERSITYGRLTQSGVRITRAFRFDEAHFGLVEELTLKNEGTAARTAVLDVLLVGKEREGERNEGNFFRPATDLLAGACRANDDREHFTSKDTKEPKHYPGPVSYAALDRHFFLAALVPNNVATEGCRVQGISVGEGDHAKHGLQIAVELSPVPLAPGETKTLTFKNYMGPKQLGLLEEHNAVLTENVDFGWFGAISRPMLWLLVYFNGLVGNFGIAIILLTLVLKVLTFPMTQASYVSMQKMKKLQPELKELQKKYGHDKAALGQKQMELYSKSGVNPLLGCLPMLITMPFWFALYRTLSQAVELYQQPFYGWITDLTQPDHSPLWGLPVLPLIVCALMLYQTAMQPPPEDQPQMKYVMWGMPIMFSLAMLSMASGLSIYMISNSLLTMAQQWWVKRLYKDKDDDKKS